MYTTLIYCDNAFIHDSHCIFIYNINTILTQFFHVMGVQICFFRCCAFVCLFVRHKCPSTGKWRIVIFSKVADRFHLYSRFVIFGRCATHSASILFGSFLEISDFLTYTFKKSLMWKISATKKHVWVPQTYKSSATSRRIFCTHLEYYRTYRSKYMDI